MITSPETRDYCSDYCIRIAWIIFQFTIMALSFLCVTFFLLALAAMVFYVIFGWCMMRSAYIAETRWTSAEALSWRAAGRREKGMDEEGILIMSGTGPLGQP